MTAKIINSKKNEENHTIPSNKELLTLSRFRNNYANEILTKSTKSGDLIFEPDDIVKVTDAFAKLIRMYCVDQHITWDYFLARHRAYCSSLGFPPHQINYDRNNCKRALLKTTMTKNCFEHICQVLTLVVSDISTTLVSPDGKVLTYRISDVIPAITNSLSKLPDDEAALLVANLK